MALGTESAMASGCTHTRHSIGALATFRTRYLSVGVPVGKGVGSAVGLHKYSLRRDRGQELICSLKPLHNKRISFTKLQTPPIPGYNLLEVSLLNACAIKLTLAWVMALELKWAMESDSTWG